VQTGASTVERELADRYAQAVCALIAKPQNTLAVAHHDCFKLRRQRPSITSTKVSMETYVCPIDGLHGPLLISSEWVKSNEEET
jgi:hypothetical protein